MLASAHRPEQGSRRFAARSLARISAPPIPVGYSGTPFQQQPDDGGLLFAGLGRTGSTRRPARHANMLAVNFGPFENRGGFPREIASSESRDAGCHRCGHRCAPCSIRRTTICSSWSS
jgi:hypothetical protein